jgi:hypothetical protein
MAFPAQDKESIPADQVDATLTGHPGRSAYLFESCFRNLAISSGEGGQSVSHVLQWNTNAPDFNAS